MNIDQKGTITMDGGEFRSESAFRNGLRERLREMQSAGKDMRESSILLRADRRVKMEDVAWVLASARDLGIRQVSLAMRSDKDPKSFVEYHLPLRYQD